MNYSSLRTHNEKKINLIDSSPLISITTPSLTEIAEIMPIFQAVVSAAIINSCVSRKKVHRTVCELNEIKMGRIFHIFKELYRFP
jgi:hypothetical protein